VAPEAANYQRQIGSDLLVVTNRNGNVLFASGLEARSATVAALPEIRSALAGREANGFWPQSNGVLQVVTVPILIGLEGPEILGTLTVGFQLDNTLAEQFKRLTESDIAFAVDGAIRASTLATGDQSRLASLLGSEGVSTVSLNGGEYVALLRPLSSVASAAASGPAATAGLTARAPTAVILRSRTERLQFLDAIHTGLAILAIVAVLLATILSYAVARTVTRPLAAITDTMREMATTGDLTRKVPVRGSVSWEDEDARLLATTFNTLTDSIARFQAEAAQRDRLSALGRLSTVIAHEIRNPLMIIKGSLRTLRREQQATPEETRQALTDVDEEVVRLNRVVNDVLDFARPIRFDYAPADLNAVCAEAVAASREADPEASVRIETDPKIAPIVTDAERLRTALVNILTNARHAVAARQTNASQSSSSGAPDIELRTLQTLQTTNGGGMASVIIKDRGIGIRPEDLPRIFDPYFTTKRTGSGLGLAIAKNIIEGMGASITLESRAGGGTEIRIDLPVQAKEAR
jgi:signal transduction histidine kinase